MADTYLICEGSANSVDLRVLDMIVAQRLCSGVNLRIVPSGGDSGLGAVRVHHEEKSRQRRTSGNNRGKLGRPVDKAFSIQDRNFNSRQRADDTWVLPGRSFMWRRHEIENYLLVPRVVLTAFNSLRVAPGYVGAPWVQHLPVDEGSVSSLLRDLARPMLEDHAGQLLRCSLDATIKQGRAFSLPNPGRSTSGWNKSGWLTYLDQQGQRIKAECNTVTVLPELAPSAMDQQYDAIFAPIGDSQFLTSGQFLEDMDGHALMAALLAHIRSIGGRNLSTDMLQEELINALDREYGPNLFNPDDFAELAAKLS